MSHRIDRPEMQDFGELDLLADILGDAHRGVVYARRWFPGTWALGIEDIDVGAFYTVTHGELVIRLPGEEPTTLREGDMAFVSGHHVVASDAVTRPLPFTIDRVRSLSVGEGVGKMCMLCWAYLLDRPDHPVFSRLPPIILLRAGERAPAVDALVALLAQEFDAFAPGGRTLVAHLTDAILVWVLRHWIASDRASDPWIRALRDPVLARALALVHNDYARPWTLESLARASGASRATLARNFRSAVGTTPMRFLTRRRLAVAKELVERTTMTLEEVAAEVGYGSAFSLSKAFKRVYGAAPTHL